MSKKIAVKFERQNRTCEVHGAQWVDMVVNVGGVRATITTIRTCKLWLRAHQTDSQPIAVVVHLIFSTLQHLNGMSHACQASPNNHIERNTESMPFIPCDWTHPSV